MPAGATATMTYVPNPAGIDAAARIGGTIAVEFLKDEVVDIAQSIAPVLSGTYRDSITSTETGQGALGPEASVYSDVRYAPFLEFGTSDTPVFATLRRASEGAHI